MRNSQTQPKLVVGIGASAGGLEAFKQFLAALPKDNKLAYLLVQHLNPTHTSRLAELVSSSTALEVRYADDGADIEPNTVYVIRPGTTLRVKQGKIEISKAALQGNLRLPIDHLFRSLAQEYGPRAVGVILSGTGSDGAEGTREIATAGGLVIVQDPKTCTQSGMPQSALDSGSVDLILSIADIPAALQRFATLPSQQSEPPPTGEEAASPSPLNGISEPALARLAALLEARLRFDLRAYKSTTIERRVLRRMMLAGFDSIECYLDSLRSDDSELHALVRSLLINVTEFFRDPDAFRALRQLTIDPLVAHATPGDTLRVWIAGCATGQEAYSLAMEFLDSIQVHDKRLALQIFATDIDQDVLAFARAGVYPLAIADQVPPPRLQTYFNRVEGKGYQVRPVLRDAISFAAHDITKDPPFSRMHLVSCRNLLIYLTPEAKQHALQVLHFALEPDGHLFLSTSESTGPQRELFTTVSKSHRIYRKLGSSRSVVRTDSRRPPLQLQNPGPSARLTPSHVPLRALRVGDIARRAALDVFAPPTLVVSEDGAVIFTHGELAPYLRIPDGDNPRLELDTLLRPEIATRTRGAIYQCRRRREPVSVQSTPKPGSLRVRITAWPAPTLGDGAVLLTFEVPSNDEIPDPSARVENPEQDAIIDQLEKELSATREDLRNTVEELENSNAELRSSNEESMSMNEEIQSTLEELEATTEELRSLNTELVTVNGQLRENVEQLESAHDDLRNFFASTKIATIFLDSRRCIKRFTPAASEMLGLEEADEGRFIGEVARDLLHHDLDDDAKAVLDCLSARSREIRTNDGRWIARDVLPYRTENRRIEGVVVNLVDITALKLATERLVLRERQQRVIGHLGLYALREINPQRFLEQVVRDVQQTLDTGYCEILELQPGGKSLLLRAAVGWQNDGSTYVGAGADSQAGYTLQSPEPVIVEDFATERRFSGPRPLPGHAVASGVSCLIVGDRKLPYGVLGVHTRHRRTFSREDASFLQAVGSVVGCAIARYQAHVRMTLELAVAQVLADTTDIAAMWDVLLERMATAWSPSTTVAELWWLEGATLIRRALYVTPTNAASGPIRAADRLAGTLSLSDGFVGQALESGRATAATDLSDPHAFSRTEGAEALGLVSGLALPISRGNHRSGVISLLSCDRLFADHTSLHSFEAIGRSIGGFIASWEADDTARQLAAITSSSHDAIFSYRLDGQVTRWLSGAEKLFGHAAAEMVGDSIYKIVPSEERAQLRAVNERILAGEVVEPFETMRLRKDGSQVAVSIRSSPVHDRKGDIVGVSCTDRDITAQKEVESRLLEGDRQKDEFLAMLGHELRNPLAAIRNAAELLKFTDSNAQNLQNIQAVVERQSTHMAVILDGLLDVSRIICGKIHLETTTIDLVALCRGIVSDVNARTQRSSPRVNIDEPLGPIWIEGDPVRLAQVFDNLLTNAIKYTPQEGSVVLAVGREAQQACVKVVDTGVGIDADLLPHVFEIFRQSKQTLDRSLGGLGLGLALVKSLAEMHGGSVVAKSAGKDQGSEFVVRLPITEKRIRELQSPPQSNEPMHILLIEDNVDSAEMLKQILELMGHHVTLTTHARQGVDIAVARSHELDVVLCDIGLPGGMSGFDVAIALRRKNLKQRPFLVALSGYGGSEDKARCAEAGFDTHLTKPVDIACISSVLDGIRSKKELVWTEPRV